MYQTKEDGRIQSLPYDKFKTYGGHALSDEELLAIILRTGCGGEDATALACHVMDEIGRDKGLLGLYHTSLKELLQIRGIGEVKAIKLMAIAELSTRIAVARIRKDICLKSASAVADAYMERMRHLEKEECMVVFLDTSDHRLTDLVISIGNLNSTLISSREIFRQALKINASSIILLHNHPSGNPSPSRQDLIMTAKMLQAGDFMEIPLLDHVIIGDGCYYSLREKGDL